MKRCAILRYFFHQTFIFLLFLRNLLLDEIAFPIKLATLSRELIVLPRFSLRNPSQQFHRDAWLLFYASTSKATKCDH